jgi:secondary thiamine-phosphate synthase enzyme
MRCQHHTLSVSCRGKGTYNITRLVQELIEKSDIQEGLLTVLCQHTSCSLVLMENADPSARADLEAFMERLVPENEPYFTHIYEGADDMPSHIKMALTRSSESIPVTRGSLMLGTWQGLFLWEHRDNPHHRNLVVTIIGE